MQVGMQGMTFRGLTQIRLPNHYSDNSSPVFAFTCFNEKEALSMRRAECVWVKEYVNAQLCMCMC